jgi:hypothetical protein
MFKVLSRFGYTRGARILWEVSELDTFIPTLMVDLNSLANWFACIQFAHSASKPCSRKDPSSEVSRELANNRTDKEPRSRGVRRGKLSRWSSGDVQSLSLLLTYLLSSLAGYYVLVQGLPAWYRLHQWLVLCWMRILPEVNGQEPKKIQVHPMWPS